MNRVRARRCVAAAAAAVLLGALAVGLTASAATGGAFRDDFNPEGYGGSDGTLAWAGPWQEIGESDGFVDGAARVKAGVACASGPCLELGTFVGADGVGVSRRLDLAGSTSATLTFSYGLVRKAGSGAIVVSASASGTAPWVVLGRYRFDTAPLASVETLDISSHIGANTAIRFAIEGDGVKSRMGIDDVVVEAVGVPTTTTTTTTVPITTTTTEPPVPVTTTTVPVTTTTVPLGTTTTTTVPVTTTTEPWGTTTLTTVAPVGPGSVDPADPPDLPASSGPAALRPTEGIALASVALPPPEADVPTPGPLTRLTASFTTTVGYASNPALATLVLAATVAWLSVKGLERAPSSRRLHLRSRLRRTR